MGLDVSHDCWSGSYNTFHEFRKELFNLVQAEYSDALSNSDYAQDLQLNAPDFLDFLNFVVDCNCLDFYWNITMEFDNSIEHDAVFILLNHSDCDGIICLADAVILLPRLEQLQSFFNSYSGISFMTTKFTPDCFNSLLTDWITGIAQAIENKETIRFY